MAARRPLRFDRLDQIMPEVDRLLAGHETVGGWTLGQICRHLAVAIRLSAAAARRAEGTPPADPEAREALRRDNEARRQVVLGLGRVGEGNPTPSPLLVPPEGLDDRVEAEGLREALARLAEAPPCVANHPFLGPLAPDEWMQFHRVHCAHHLSFAVPIVASVGPS